MLHMHKVDNYYYFYYYSDVNTVCALFYLLIFKWKFIVTLIIVHFRHVKMVEVPFFCVLLEEKYQKELISVFLCIAFILITLLLYLFHVQSLANKE